MLKRSTAAVLVILSGLCVYHAQTPNSSTPSGAPAPSDVPYVEKVLVARRDYQKSLEVLRAHYLKVGDVEKSRWAEEELLQYHRAPKPSYNLELIVPPPNLRASVNIPEANQLYTAAMTFKNRGWYNEYIDNQRRAELLLQQILTQYPESNKISDVAYQLGDIYESKAYRQYRLAALYFERCVQWNPTTQLDARLRAARIYDRNLQERGDATRLYKEVLTHETDTTRHAEAKKRLGETSPK